METFTPESTASIISYIERKAQENKFTTFQLLDIAIKLLEKIAIYESWDGSITGTFIARDLRDFANNITNWAAKEISNVNPSGCYTEMPGTRDCPTNGHYSCASCSRNKKQ